MNIYAHLADSVLVLHALYIAFVVVGFVLILIGMVRHWDWIKNGLFRLLHLSAIGFVIAESWLGLECPLTRLESYLRTAAGEAVYAATFIEFWLHKILFFTLPPWVFTLIYTVFGLLVVLAWVLVPPYFRRKSNNSRGL